MVTAVDTATTRSLQALLRELLDGTSPESTWVLNPEDQGLLQSLAILTADEASRVPPNGGASIAAHVDHLRYGLSLMNRWNDGENPFASANYSASWKRQRVSDQQWKSLLDQLDTEAHKWLSAISSPREMSDVELTGMISSVVHLGYHLGAIRQIDRATRGPAARD